MYPMGNVDNRTPDLLGKGHVIQSFSSQTELAKINVLFKNVINGEIKRHQFTEGPMHVVKVYKKTQIPLNLQYI